MSKNRRPKNILKKRTSGITLIALVVTIIVLLILAGISIMMLSGNNGILTRAGQAKKDTEEKSIFENIGLAYNSGKIEKYTGTKTLAEKMGEELVAIYGTENVQVKDNGDETYTVTVNKQKYNIADGQIEKIEPVVNPYDPNAWEKAWVYPTTDGKWSNEISKNASLPENYEIIAKFYKVSELDEKYSLVIEGEGDMPSLRDTNGYSAWQTNLQSNENGAENPTDIEIIYICDGITSIGHYAFIGCTSLENIKISNSVTSIGNSAFAFCTNLASIHIPNSVTRIEVGAFGECISLNEIEISKSITSIEDATFVKCSRLTSISIPDSVTGIGSHAFQECTALKEIKLSKNVERIDLHYWIGKSYTEITEVTENNYDIKVRWKDNDYYFVKE